MKTINLLYQFDAKYAPYAAVSLVSLLENNKNNHFAVYLLALEVPEEFCKNISETVKKYGSSVFFLDPKPIEEKLKELGIPKYRGSYTTNYKLFPAEVLPDGLERILYLDCDTIITGDLEPLYNVDLEGKPIGMARDALGDLHARILGMPKKTVYVNGGVILFDLKNWKKRRCSERIAEYAVRVRAHFMSPDQDLLNLVLGKDEIKVLPPEYNLQPVHKVYSPKMYRRYWKWEDYYSDEELEHAVRHPVITHCFRYLGEFPWHLNSLHPDAKLWDRYFSLCTWLSYKKEPAEQQGTVFSIERWLYIHLPKALFLPIFRICYNLFIRKCWRESENGRENAKM